ncbi:MAG: histidine phosphatase family protein [Alphaproteobacteria bacterium]|nr:histidine phosphatase family protein [Alphaproteobacteria bacterium]
MALRAAALGLALALGATGIAVAQGVPPPAPGRSAMPVRPLADAELLEALRQGGLVLYIRHTATDFSRNDAKSRHAADCANQRPLTDEGRAQARRISAALKQLDVPIARALASPLCRTVETGELVFAPLVQGQIEPDVRARGERSADGDDYAGLRAIFRQALPPGGNLGIASHGNPFVAIAGAPYLAEGEMAVVRPLGSDFEVIARIRHEDWERLLKP